MFAVTGRKMFPGFAYEQIQKPKQKRVTLRIHGSITIGNTHYQEGDLIPWNKVYPFFLIHMLAFGGSGFFLAYFVRDEESGIGKIAIEVLLYAHGGFAILIYLAFYLAFFGKDEVKWMVINSVFGFAAIYTQIDWILKIFNKSVNHFPLYIHVIPFLYFVLYTFLLRQAFIDIINSRDDKGRERIANVIYVAISILVYGVSYLLMKRET